MQTPWVCTEGLKAASLEAETVNRLLGSDARKVAIARVIRQNTTVSMSCLAEHLAMRCAANASQQFLCKSGTRKPKRICRNPSKHG
jgi:hypothetical protein